MQRPDLNGIEVFWRYAKQIYRSAIDGHKINGRDWQQMIVVKECMESVSEEKAKRAAAQGWDNVRNARPLLPASNDRFPLERHRLYLPRILNLEEDEDA